MYRYREGIDIFNHAIGADIWGQLQAKAVMERDLSVLRKKRVERERLAKGLKAQPSPEEVVGIPQLGENGPSETVSANETAQSTGEENGEDVITADAALEAGLVGSNDELQADSDTNITNYPSMPQDAENSMGLAITMPQNPTAEVIEPLKSPDKKFGGATQVAEAPLDTSTADLDFESMFNDTDLTGADDTMNFGIDFSAEGNLSQDVLTDSAFEDIEMSNADISNLGATTSEDINTLLPGLENFVNAGTDFSNINIPVAPTLPETTLVAPSGTVGAPAQHPTQPVVADSNFDDIFESGDFSMEGTGDDGMGTGTLGDFEDFDEEWFKTDPT